MVSRYNYYPGGTFNRFYRTDPVDVYTSGKPVVLSRSEFNRRKAVEKRAAWYKRQAEWKHIRIGHAKELSRRHKARYAEELALLAKNSSDVFKPTAAQLQQMDAGWKDEDFPVNPMGRQTFAGIPWLRHSSYGDTFKALRESYEV